MTPSFTERARNQWAMLPAAEFEAVYQVRAGLDDVSDSGDWRHLRVVSHAAVDGVEVRLVENQGVFVLIDGSRLEVFALGRPGL